MSFKEKEHLDLETSESFTDKEAGYRETAWSSRENEKEYNTPKFTSLQLVENVEYEFPATIEYLQDEQRYEEPDDSLHLGKEEYLESVGYSEDADTPVEEDAYDEPECIIYDSKEDYLYSETMEFSDEEQNYEDSETGMSLEEEEEKNMEGCHDIMGRGAEERHQMAAEKQLHKNFLDLSNLEFPQRKKKVFKDVLSCLNLDTSRKLLPDFVKQFFLDRGCRWVTETPGDLAWNFLMKVQALDMTVRDSILRHKVLGEDSKGEFLTGVENLEIRETETINPLDVLCASMLYSDSSLQREVMSNICRKEQKHFNAGGHEGHCEGAVNAVFRKAYREYRKFLTLMKMPVISFVRLGYCSFSKSRILNTLLSPAHLKSHKIFLHQDLPVLVLPQQISDGLVEVTWSFPDSDGLKENPSFSQKAVAVANLLGDLESEKEWDLLMFLGEAAIERCYFVLSSQARENEEAQIFQRILKLKPSQLLFWEEEEAGERGRNMEGLQAALKEVMSSSLRCVSVEDIAPLARELGIQIDHDFENMQRIQVSPTENLAGTAEDEGPQRHSQPNNSSESPA
eukprot:bmy_06107T0